MTLKSGVGSIQFYPDKPLLETELNELQSVQNEAREDIIRDSIPSGFTQLGELDFDYMLNNENKVKLKTDSVAFVNGMRIFIPAGTIVDIGKAPEKESREDLIFLEVWKEEVGADGALTEYGGDGQASLKNHMKDERVGSETAKRIINRWRIRHVTDVDFSYYPEGFHRSGSIWRGDEVTVMGGNTEPLPFSVTNAFNSIGLGNDDDTYRGIKYKDVGLYVAGRGTSDTKTLFKSSDGYCYAIPMFRLYRKPSCGKSIPFEYSKINPKVDYLKFTKLMQEEKVERVHSENIEGRSLVNIDSGYYNSYFAPESTINITDIPNGKRFTKANSNNYWQYIFVGNFMGRLKPSTTYTVSLKYKTNRAITLPFNIPIQTGEAQNFVTSVVFSKYENGRIIGKFNTPSSWVGSTQRMYLSTSTWNNGDFLEVSESIIVEGDLVDNTNLIPSFFLGLQSLGEDDGNLVTVKNGVLNDNTYDPCDGNQKLNTFSNVTHVMSENTIIPEFTAELKKDGAKQSDVTAFGKLTTEGNEQVEFTKIKGRTLQNLLPKHTIQYTSTADYDGYYAIRANTHLIKANTNYTLIFNVKKFNNTSGNGYYLINNVHETTSLLETMVGIGNSNLGINRVLVKSRSVLPPITSDTCVLRCQNGTSRAEIEITDFVLLEGDYTQTPLEKLPYIEGIKSLGETNGNVVNLTSMGKNIWNGNNKYVLPYKSTLHKVKLPNNSTKLRLSYDLLSTDYLFVFLSNVDTFHANHDTLYSLVVANGRGKEISYVNPKSTIIDNSEGYKYLYVTGGVGNSGGINVENIQLEVGNTLTEFEPYKEYKQEIYLKEPLRSLPNGVCDEIVGNKVIRRVGKVVLDRSESWQDNGGNADKSTFCGYVDLMSINNTKTNSFSMLCDKIPCKLSSINGDETSFIVGTSGSYMSMIYVTIEKSKLSSPDITGLKTWLSQNPTTLYYELANPAEEYLEHVYEKESIKTYQLDAPLRSLPNGVKDEIKNGVLIRRCATTILTGKDFATTDSGTNSLFPDFYSAYVKEIADRKATPNNVRGILCNKLDSVSNDDFANKAIAMNNITANNSGVISGAPTGVCVKILKTELSSPDLDGIKAWVDANPLTIIYELKEPIETILTEAKPQVSDFSLQKQFKEGNWLRELPNGVKDIVADGKVTRKVGKTIYNGSENWTQSGTFTDNNFLVVALNLGLSGIIVDTPSNNLNLVCNNFKVSRLMFDTTNKEEGVVVSRTETVWFCILKSRLTSPDASGFKAWLAQNPTTLLYELATPTEEVISKDNYTYFPCHDFNSYCGSIYVGQGRNHIVNINKLPSENNVAIDTSFRIIEGKAVVTDCQYRKQTDGYTTEYIGSKTKNLISKSMYDNRWFMGENPHVDYNDATGKHFSIYNIRIKPNTQYYFSSDKTVNRFNGKWLDKDRNFISAFYIPDGVSSGYQKSSMPKSPSNAYYLCIYIDSTGVLMSSNYNIQLEEGSTNTDYVDYIQTTKYFENTESNDMEDLRHLVTLTGFNYDKILNESFDKLLRGEL